MTQPRQEQRAFPRVSAPIRACLIGADGERSEIPVRDIGMGGLFVFSPYLLAEVGERRELEIGLPDGSYFLQLHAEVMRASVAPDSDQLLGLAFQFVDVTAEQQARMSELLGRLLQGSGGDKRAYPRISHQLEVGLSGAVDVRCILRDLSAGGAGLWVDTPLAVGQHLTLQLPATPEPLALPARVVSTRWPQHDEPYGQAGVQFTELDREQRHALGAYLDRVLRG